MLYQKNRAKELDTALFKNPTSEYRGAPFWSWNCKLTKGLLEKEIIDLKDMGFGGFHMHVRAGLQTPYLSDEFMDFIKFCQQKAEKEDMLAYLYDEDRWPSGYAGGFVTKNPKYREKCLRFTTRKLPADPKDEAVEKGLTYLFACYDIILSDDGGLVSSRVIDEDEEAVGFKRYAYVEASRPSERYNYQTRVDSLCKEAVDKFLEITYEAYKKHVGDKFGTTHPAIFTDEPSFKKYVALPSPFSDDDGVCPWTTDLPESFESATGYSLKEVLPELFWNPVGQDYSRIRYLFLDHVCEKFTNAFVDNIYKWCSENGISFTGHMVSEPTLESQTRSIGEAMRAYRSFHIPGIDMLCEWMEYNTAKQCQSAKNQFGREAMMSELYGVTGWDYDFRGHKFQGDWQAALGVTLRVPHLTWMSMKGSSKRDYPACIGYQSPWYKEYPYIEDHYARVNTAMTRGKPVVKIGVIHPIESYWLIYADAQSSIGLREDLDDNFARITQWLLFTQNDFDYICESTLPQLYKDGEKGFTVGEMTYETIIVPPMKTIRSTTLERLEAFVKRGGKLIFAGEVPSLVDAEKSDRAIRLSERAMKVQFSKHSLARAVADEKVVSIINTDGDSTGNLIYQLREDADCLWLFIVHGTKAKNPDAIEPFDAIISIKGEYAPELYDTLTGSVSELNCCYSNGKTVINRIIHGHDSLLIKLNKNKKSESVQTAEETDKVIKTIDFKEPVSYKRAEPNVYILDSAEWKLNDGEWQPKEEMLRIDLACRKILGYPSADGGGTQPWVLPDEPAKNFVTFRYEIPSECEVPSPLLAVEELVSGKLNGQEFPVEFTGYFTDLDIKTVKLPPIRKGLNTLELVMPITARISTEYAYLLGEFDVAVRGCEKTILPASNKIGFSDITPQGLPFYGGNLSYFVDIDVPDCDLIIRANQYRGSLLKVFIDGDEAGKIVFSPYKLRINGVKGGKHRIEFLCFGNRHNTFSSLHNANTSMTYVSPGNWYHKGENWCYEYRIKPMGILTSPVIEVVASD